MCKYPKSVEILNQLLCNVFVLYVKLWNFHWNFRGPTFVDRHTLFGGYKDQLSGHIDLLAERIRQLGETPKSSMKEFLASATLKEGESTPICEDCSIPALLEDFKMLSAATSKGGVLSEEDLGTQTLLADLLLEYDKISWFLESNLKTESKVSIVEVDIVAGDDKETERIASELND